MLTGNKDVDRKILNELEDVDLVRVCQTNKKANTLCNDQVFWMNRVFDKFGYVGGDVLRTNKRTNQSWSDYYIHDLRKINSNNAQKYLQDGSRDGRLDHVIISLNLGADIHGKNEYALIWASMNGQLDVVKYLVENGAGKINGALVEASSRGELDVVKYLVENGADIHASNDAALRWASEEGQNEVVKYLVENGADIHARNDEALIIY